MSNTALLSLDSRTNKWTAIYAGQVVAASFSKDYVVNGIKEGRCSKAKKLNVTNVREFGTPVFELDAPTIESSERFNINERFDFLSDFVRMVATGTSPSLIVTGEGGLGKTFTVNKTLVKCGMKKIDSVTSDGTPTEVCARGGDSKSYVVIKGFSTAKGLYRILYENRKRIIIFDDCDDVLKNPTALLILKGALDSYEERVVDWRSEGFMDDGLPRSFMFEGGVIFISNLPIYKVDQAIRSRAICVDVSMTVDQKIERMGNIIKSGDFLPDHSDETKEAALAFLTRMRNEAKELSLRTLISVTKVASLGDNWERRAEYLLTSV